MDYCTSTSGEVAKVWTSLLFIRVLFFELAFLTIPLQSPSEGFLLPRGAIHTIEHPEPPLPGEHCSHYYFGASSLSTCHSTSPQAQ